MQMKGCSSYVALQLQNVPPGLGLCAVKLTGIGSDGPWKGNENGNDAPGLLTPGPPPQVTLWIPSRCVGPGSFADRKSTRLNSSHEWISYAVFCLKKKKK